jgi:hypothetical protein
MVFQSKEGKSTDLSESTDEAFDVSRCLLDSVWWWSEDLSEQRADAGQLQFI